MPIKKVVPLTSIGDVQWRERVRVRGRVRSMRIQPWSGVATLECVIVDDTGGLTLVFLGRRKVAGLTLGAWVEASGMAGEQRGYLAILNPEFQIVAGGLPV